VELGEPVRLVVQVGPHWTLAPEHVLRPFELLVHVLVAMLSALRALRG